MNAHWKMNRIGFVNFWLYDEEIIDLTDGKLLLRGQNGSGKSITTQSFIPFILDGDRTPSRLDPFGSSDRRMEYYFLGEEGKEEATGYLFLEFKKEQSGEYRTIGIGQRARRGKPMDFWGFVILDGRRIGVDLQLYKETGSTKLPFSKQELKNVLGDSTPFTDVPGEYKALVNKHIFGFRRPEQYEQFIRLLVKVRAPKLSKEFKPTKVYEILNESLQTLTDEDLRAMVDAMEKMDGIQENLEQLSRAFADVKTIRNEYTRYNQFMLARKAQAYLSKNQEVEVEQQRLKEQEEECQTLLEEIKAAKEDAGRKEDRCSLINTELVSLLDTDMEEADRKLDKALEDKNDASEQEKRWEDRFMACQDKIRESENAQKRLQTEAEVEDEKLQDAQDEMENLQETLQWEQHNHAVEVLRSRREEELDTIAESLHAYNQQITAGKQAIERLATAQAEYDHKAEGFEEIRRQKEEKERAEQELQENLLNHEDQLIVDLFQMKEHEQWKPSQTVLTMAEEKIRGYERADLGEDIRGILRADWEKAKAKLFSVQNEKEQEKKKQEEALSQTEKEWREVQQQKELQPPRTEETERFRKSLSDAGVDFVPFYKAVEFSPEISAAEQARLEAQLMQAGILDALVMASWDFEKLKQSYPQMTDGVLHVKKQGTSPFNKLIINEELSPQLQAEVERILSNIYETEEEGTLSLAENGYFHQGILYGRADKSGEAEFVGSLARERKKEQTLRLLEETIAQQKEILAQLDKEIAALKTREEKLKEEYNNIPDFKPINQVLEQIRQCQFELTLLAGQYLKQEKELRAWEEQKNRAYQEMLQHCRTLPFGRTQVEYQAALEDIGLYQRLWRQVQSSVQKIGKIRSDLRREQETADDSAGQADEAYREKQRYVKRIQELEIQIHKYEEYLNSPENKEKADKVKSLKQELGELQKQIEKLRTSISANEERRLVYLEQEAGKKEALQEKIIEETGLLKYFKEELALKLVIESEGKTFVEAAKMAVGMLRENDKGREPEELLNSLYRVYQQHNSNLSSYGTSMEDCFDEVEEGVHGTRKRVRLVSTWNGKKLYLEEFFQTLKTTIEETELLIQEKDRELFEDILSQTISQQLTDRIAESRKWVQDMSRLMKQMDTSMGLSFSLDWRPKSAESEEELDTQELEHILLRDRELLTTQDIERVAAHFRSKIQTEKRKLEEDGTVVNYMELVRDALDYRRWFTFQLSFYRNQEGKKPLTNAAFNRFSGGEKAMAMYVPLFAAVNAQYQKAENKDHPRIIALDEAFAGVDDKNISSMFELVEKLDFDYIMNSQALWGCYETVKGLKIAELYRPLNSQIVTVIYYTWNGHERILDEQ